LNLTVADGTVTELGFDISGSFTIFSLTVSTVQGQPLSFNYNLQQDQYEIAGGLQLEFSDNFILADFGSSSAPGIIIAAGQLTQLSGTVSGTIELAKATISSQGLTVCYNRDQDQFEMYGGLAVQVPTGGTTQSLSAQMARRRPRGWSSWTAR